MKKMILCATAVATAAVLASACSGSSKAGTKKLESGNYEYDVASVSPDSCFDAATEMLLMTQGLLKFALTSTSATSFVFNPPTIAAAIIPPIVGTRTGDALSASGMTVYAVDSKCSLTITAGLTGVMTADDKFTADIALGISAMGLNSAGTGNSNCAKNHGTTIGGVVPFPTLTPVTNGTCAITLHGSSFDTFM